MRSVMDEADVARALRRMAHELIESADPLDETILIGIVTRGVDLARRLAANVAEIAGVHIPVGALNVDRYRDDGLPSDAASRPGTDLPDPVTGRTVVLVDDVLFTGRTVRAALDGLSDLGRPGRVRLAVLIDRGHRELPIRADHVGKNLPTSRNERVTVRMAETDGLDGVVLEPTVTAVTGRMR